VGIEARDPRNGYQNPVAKQHDLLGGSRQMGLVATALYEGVTAMSAVAVDSSKVKGGGKGPAKKAVKRLGMSGHAVLLPKKVWDDHMRAVSRIGQHALLASQRVTSPAVGNSAAGVSAATASHNRVIAEQRKAAAKERLLSGGAESAPRGALGELDANGPVASMGDRAAEPAAKRRKRASLPRGVDLPLPPPAAVFYTRHEYGSALAGAMLLGPKLKGAAVARKMREMR
jgi:hypothetical protein